MSSENSKQAKKRKLVQHASIKLMNSSLHSNLILLESLVKKNGSRVLAVRISIEVSHCEGVQNRMLCN